VVERDGTDATGIDEEEEEEDRLAAVEVAVAAVREEFRRSREGQSQ
jgi:cation transport regulator ChaB